MRAFAIKGRFGAITEISLNEDFMRALSSFSGGGKTFVEGKFIEREPGATDSSSPVATGAPSGQHSGSQPICPPNKCINPDASGMPCDGVRKICIHAQHVVPPAQAGSGMVAVSADMLKKLSGTADDRYEALDYLRGMLAAAERAP